MTDDLWIEVVGWAKFQHYKDRRPAWIKLYLELRDKDEWRELTLADQGLLVNIWLEWDPSHGLLSTRTLPARIPHKVYMRSLDSLVAAGFITLSASKPLALTRAPALAKRGTTYLKESASAAEPASGAALALNKEARQAELVAQAAKVAAGWNGGSSDAFDEELDRLERDLHARIPYTLRAKLWDDALHRQE